jgi:hypothetical protein
MDWLQHIHGVKKVFLTHGEEASRQELGRKITTNLGISDIVLPHMNQEINI